MKIRGQTSNTFEGQTSNLKSYCGFRCYWRSFASIRGSPTFSLPASRSLLRASRFLLLQRTLTWFILVIRHGYCIVKHVCFEKPIPFDQTETTLKKRI